MSRSRTEHGLYLKSEFLDEREMQPSLSLFRSPFGKALGRWQGPSLELIISLPRAEAIVTSVLLLSLSQVQVVVFVFVLLLFFSGGCFKVAQVVGILLENKSKPRIAQTGIIWLMVK